MFPFSLHFSFFLSLLSVPHLRPEAGWSQSIPAYPASSPHPGRFEEPEFCQGGDKKTWHFCSIAALGNKGLWTPAPGQAGELMLDPYTLARLGLK